jgi:thiamine pyrophosphokinase
MQIVSAESQTKRVLGILGGGYLPPGVLREWAQSADLIIAADAGFTLARMADIVPNFVIGDFDSVSRDDIPDEMILHDAGQDDTDCAKLLTYLAAQGHQRVFLAGTEGDLMDHQIDAIHTAARSRLEIRFVLTRGIAYIVREATELVVPSSIGKRVSWLPITDVSGAALEGVKWPFENQTLSPTGFTSISNMATLDTVRASQTSGVSYLFVERSDVCWDA